ncbi:biotin/lipoyl-binding protein [Butyrivibrio fibrisolvens]|uniref:biotin/lipoyl-binding protein n=1 Tax=Pseudobutyrivibrio ruminis TaxID=46206 RepID=UPI000408E665|nr:biotin/lipoyl-binding protein [Pseudobutyrivibrio ruminis]MDC7278140.1 biotin/lipoyl-binding protein [Butyrivibrio fibrisolvens]
MKKIIKVVLILVVLAAVVTGGLYLGYTYKQGKKIAKVAPLSNLGTDEYWGDSIESFGQVTADKSQMGYLPSKSEVLSVNVKEGDHVEEGDVILTVKKDSQDINNKKLQISKAMHTLSVEQLKLNRLMKTEPVPTYIYQQDVYADYHYVEAVEYYDSSVLIGEELFDYHGNTVGFTGVDTDDTTGETIKYPVESESAIQAIKNRATEKKDRNGVYSYLRSNTYFDYETGKVVGETSYSIDGDVIDEKKKPEGMNAQELNEAILDAQDSVKKQDLEIRKLQYELETMENTTDTGDVVAKVSGTVSKVQDLNNYNTTQPFFIVTATDEYYISGSIGEFYLDQLHIGDIVSISCWDNGATADGKVTSISDTPAKDGGNFWTSGNSNSSNYEFKASFDKNSGIDIGSAVDISITPSGQEEKGIYIPAYLIRKDAGGSYVMRMNDSNKLEKAYIKVGKTVWGSQTQVKSGITMDDYLAFPYGDGAIEGIKCEQVEYLDEYGGLG